MSRCVFCKIIYSIFNLSDWILQQLTLDPSLCHSVPSVFLPAPTIRPYFLPANHADYRPNAGPPIDNILPCRGNTYSLCAKTAPSRLPSIQLLPRIVTARKTIAHTPSAEAMYLPVPISWNSS